ncbi:MAG: hypothetical protein JRN26_04760, partial [Nitrososphaerota archaeon]|nr:hypothetical protein [Nitrososphaerota archaeon]
IFSENDAKSLIPIQDGRASMKGIHMPLPKPNGTNVFGGRKMVWGVQRVANKRDVFFNLLNDCFRIKYTKRKIHMTFYRTYPTAARSLNTKQGFVFSLFHQANSIIRT